MFEGLFSTVSDVKEKTRIHSYMTLMIKILGHPGCVFEHTSSATLSIQLIKKVHMKNEIHLNSHFYKIKSEIGVCCSNTRFSV
jgi:hypothetical protein